VPPERGLERAERRGPRGNIQKGTLEQFPEPARTVAVGPAKEVGHMLRKCKRTFAVEPPKCRVGAYKDVESLGGRAEWSRVAKAKRGEGAAGARNGR